MMATRSATFWLLTCRERLVSCVRIVRRKLPPETLLTGGRNIETLRFLEDSKASVEALRNHELVGKVFMRCNTALPSSVSVERVSSVAADIFIGKRGKTTDENFKRQLLSKLNSNRAL